MAKKPRIRRKIYHQNYYRAQAILRDPWFKEKAAWLKKRLSDAGCPLPARPFKTYREFLKWNDTFWKRFSEIEHSPEFIKEKERITGGKDRISIEEYSELEDLREQLLPPMYGQVFRDILNYFRIGKDDDAGFRDFLEHYFFYGKTEYSTSLFAISFKRNEKTDEFELFVRIYGHTKKEDIVRDWEWIAQEQKRLKDYVGKNKAWETFNRDMEIYDLYKALREESGKKRHKKWQSTDMWIYSDLHDRYPDLTTENIRTIVSRTRERLGEA